MINAGKVITITEADKKTGQKGPIGMVSEVHTGTGQAVYNMTAIFLQSVVKEKNLNAVIINDSAVFLRYYAPDKREINFYFDRRNLQTDGTDEDAKDYASLPVIAYILSNIISGAEDCGVRFEAALEEFKQNENVSRSSLAMLCDCFYYAPFSAGILENEISVETGINITETLNQAIRKNVVKPIPMLNDLGLPQIIDFKNLITEEKSEDKFADVQIGKYRMDESNFAHPELIPSLGRLKDYVPTPSFWKGFNKMNICLNKCKTKMNAGLKGSDAIGNDYINLLMVGRPGTGKTVTAYALAAALGLPICTITLGKGTEEDKFEGMTKLVDGQLQAVGSDFERIYTTGGIILLEEINLPMQDMLMGAIGQALVFPFVLMKDGYQTVHRHPLCIIIGTMNTGTAGSKKVNEALSSRFPWKFRLDDPKEEDFIKILMASGDYKKKDVMNVYKAYSSILNYLNDPMNPRGEAAMNITMRQCIGALASLEEGCSLDEAIEDTMIGSLAETDLELAEEVYQNVVKSISF